MQGPPGPPGPPGQGHGKVLISKTGNKVQVTSLGQHSMPMVPPGVTVTPAAGRVLNNISIRKMGSMGGMGVPMSSAGGLSMVPGGVALHHGGQHQQLHHQQQQQLGHQQLGSRESLQSSPDSTSQEPEPPHQTLHGQEQGGSKERLQDIDQSNAPDSQGFESHGKRGSDTDVHEIESKRLKADGSET